MQVVATFTHLPKRFSGAPAGPGAGSRSSVTETNWSLTFTAAYTYSGPSDRQSVTYTASNGTTSYGTSQWGYFDYTALTCGSDGPPKRGFQTLSKLDGNFNPTDEQMDYCYDAQGRLVEAAFGQSHNTGYGGALGYRGGTGNIPADNRAHETITYDAEGRTLNVLYAWENWQTANGSTTLQSSTPFYQASYTYDSVKALRTGASFYKAGSGGLVLDHSETYGYDANRDWLTSANYGDGLPNANVTWGYDDAGNRTYDSSNQGTWSYDNLNRMTASPGRSYTNDILGNRTGVSNPPFLFASTYNWDELNRLTSFTTSFLGQQNANYAYRADGLRVSKATSSLTNYTFYDGQMPFQDIDITSAGTAITNNGLGARGIDYIAKTQGSTTTTVFPILDGHGNMVCDLSRSGTNTFTLNDWRSYDAWGGIRSGATTGDPKQRYCGDLGHKQDDESGLVYMRARYYEAGTGRFVNEDPDRRGVNQATYCHSDPVNYSDRTGRDEGGVGEESAGEEMEASLDESLDVFLSGPPADVNAVSLHAWEAFQDEFELMERIADAGRESEGDAFCRLQRMWDAGKAAINKGEFGATGRWEQQVRLYNTMLTLIMDEEDGGTLITVFGS